LLALPILNSSEFTPESYTLGLQQGAFLPAVRTNYYHSVASRLRECMMLMLAAGRNAISSVISEHSEESKTNNQ